MKEYEKKATITSEEYKSLLLRLKPKYKLKNTVQVNYYYDTDNFLFYHIGNTLRIRQKEEKLLLQYKYNKVMMETIRICNEYSENIDKLPMNIQKLRMNDKYINGINIFTYIGSLITNRIECKMDDEIIFLDKNYYLGNIDYEIELECGNSKNNHSLINELGVIFEPSPIGKYRRFVSRLNDFANVISPKL